MSRERSCRVLTINTGSSSLKASLYEAGAAESRRLELEADRIGRAGSRVRVTDGAGAVLDDEPLALPHFEAALAALFGWLRDRGQTEPPDVVGHRVVHGGRRHRAPQRITPSLLVDLRALVPLAPEHLPQSLTAIGAVERAYPGMVQVACFDTAFHRDMPAVAQRYPLPRELGDAGVIRYGFHGLSYEYLVEQLRALDGERAGGRAVLAHLGNGASMAAVRNGGPVDTTMGFTPTGGLVMGTRSGDLDPGVLLYLLQERGVKSAAMLGELVNRQAGMLGVSTTSGDMRDLLAREATDPRAGEAVDLFCYQARKFVGALAAALGGLDTLVFSAGIGEHAAPVRARIAAGLEFLGVELDPGRNAAHAPVISREGSRVAVRVIPTDEDRMIARHTARLLRAERGAHVPV
jgi:acetate kinase